MSAYTARPRQIRIELHMQHPASTLWGTTGVLRDGAMLRTSGGIHDLYETNDPKPWERVSLLSLVIELPERPIWTEFNPSEVDLPSKVCCILVSFDSGSVNMSEDLNSGCNHMSAVFHLRSRIIVLA